MNIETTVQKARTMLSAVDHLDTHNLLKTLEHDVMWMALAEGLPVGDREWSTDISFYNMKYTSEITLWAYQHELNFDDYLDSKYVSYVGSDGELTLSIAKEAVHRDATVSARITVYIGMTDEYKDLLRRVGKMQMQPGHVSQAYEAIICG